MRSLFDLVPFQSPFVHSPSDLMPFIVYSAPGDVYFKFFASSAPGYSVIIFDHPTQGIFKAYRKSVFVRSYLFSLLNSDSVYFPHPYHVKLSEPFSLRSN